MCSCDAIRGAKQDRISFAAGRAMLAEGALSEPNFKRLELGGAKYDSVLAGLNQARRKPALSLCERRRVPVQRWPSR